MIKVKKKRTKSRNEKKKIEEKIPNNKTDQMPRRKKLNLVSFAGH